MLIRIIKRELRLAYLQPSEWLNPLWFMLLIITLFPISIGAQPKLLMQVAPAVAWIAALLSLLLSLERLFRDDYLDGSLEQLRLSTEPLPLIILAKIIGHWLVTGLPILVLSPLTSIFLSLNFVGWQALALTILLGTPTLLLLGSIALALTVGLKQGGMLLSLLLIPLAIPVLIFASGAIETAVQGGDYRGNLAILSAMLLLSICVAPFASAAAIKLSLQS